MLPRQALSALNMARYRTLSRFLGLPSRSGVPLVRTLAHSSKILDGSTYASEMRPQESGIPPSMLSKVRRSAQNSQGVDAARSGRQQQSSESSTSANNFGAEVHTAGQASSPSTSKVAERDSVAKVSSDSFQSLKGHIEYDIFKALTQKPFNFEKMSAVQEAVLSLLPELAEPTPSTAIPQGESAFDAGSSVRGQRTINKDLLVKAKTGTGKTLAFLVPALQARFKEIEQEKLRFQEANPGADARATSRHIADYRKKTIGALILSPTRELATQIATEASKLLTHCRDMDVRLFIGGANRRAQLRDFERYRRDIVVATPGRMNDILSEPMIRDAVSKTKVLILDEADTLLDMGFKDSIDSIVEQMPPKSERQTFLFSATVSREIRQIAKSSMKREHEFIDCVPANETNTHMHIPQYNSVLKSQEEQIAQVFRLLAHDALLHPEGGKAIVFLPTTKMTELFASLVKATRSALPWGVRGTSVFEMHSRKTQAGRDNTARDFKAQTGPGYSILVTSDVSARGVDYPGVTRVIQVGIPNTKDVYVHRIGRTGRAGKEGRADIVLLPWEQPYVQSTLQDLPLKPLATEDLQAELEKLASELDANPPKLQRVQQTPFGRSPRGRLPPPQSMSMQHPLVDRVKNLDSKIQSEVIPSISEQDASETFASQVGFYVAHGHELRMSRYDIYTQLQDWAVSALGMAEAPTVSPRLMQTMGIGQTQRSGKVRGFGAADGRRRGYDDLRSARRDSSRSSFGGSSRNDRFGRPSFSRDSDQYSRGGSSRHGDGRRSDRDDRRSFGSRDADAGRPLRRMFGGR